MISHYERVNSKRSRLGLSGMSPGADMAQSIIGQVGNIITNIIGLTEGGKTQRTAIRHQTTQVGVKMREGTLRLEISTDGQVSMAKTEVEMVKAKYGSLTNLIWGIGGIATIIMITGAGGYALIKKVSGK